VRRSPLLFAVASITAAACLPALVATSPAAAAPRHTDKQPVADGSGGAVASVDADATAAGLEILKHGGNAVDAAVATAAALGVTDPYSAGIGGGGFMVVYEAATGQVHTIDGRETAPAAMREDSFRENGRPIPFAEAVTSGLSVGVPGTPRTWEVALSRFGTQRLADVLRPAMVIAEKGFVVDQTYTNQTEANAARFRDFTSSREYFLTPDGQAPQPGTVVKNKDLAAAYRLLARDGVDGAFYNGPLGEAVARTAQQPPQVSGSERRVRPGLITTADVAGYTAPLRRPTQVGYRGLQVWGMAPPSSGGSTVGEALNILEGFDLASSPRPQALHSYLEASALAFADRNRYLGDPAYTRVPLAELLSDAYAADRRACLDPARAAAKPVPAGVPNGSYDGACGPAATPYDPATEGISTTHLTTADRFGNVVSYTLTIEQTGGSGIAVPGWGFLLNNELTDFEFTGPGPNTPAPGKRPRSSMAPTIVTQDGVPVLALGSPGGATIITTVLQVLVEHLDLGRSLPEAVAAPRASQRNSATTQAEPAFVATDGAALGGYGHRFATVPEIGALTGVALLGDGRIQAVAEPTRRGGGDARVVSPEGRRR
jgi:gamma-glutamyltranspeptidase/glutathione hydrolase